MKKEQKLEYHIKYYSNGNKCEEGYFRNGFREGEWTTWYENGDKELTAFFNEGRPCGIWMYWDCQGNYDWIDMDLV